MYFYIINIIKFIYFINEKNNEVIYKILFFLFLKFNII